MLAAAPARSRLLHQPEAGGVRDPRPLGVGIAALVMMCGLTGIVGHSVSWQPMLSPLSRWPALSLLSSIELILVGAAFLALLRADRRITLPLSALSAVISLLCIAGTLGAFTLPYGGMALSTALLHATISSAILVLRRPGQRATRNAHSVLPAL